MGLYGTMVHDAAPGTAYPGVPYAQSKTVVFSEVDPQLHQPFTSPVVATSFESPDTGNASETTAAAGWTVSGSAGVFDRAASAVPAPTDGEQAGWVAGGGTLSLPVGEPGGPDTSNPLSVDVGDRADRNFAGYSIGLYAGGVMLAEDVGAPDPNGAFMTRTLALPKVPRPWPATSASRLEIRLASTAPPLPSSPITVTGGSFEAPAAADGAEAATATGWSLSGSGAAGVFNPLAAVVPQPTDGAQAGWSNGQASWPGS